MSVPSREGGILTIPLLQARKLRAEVITLRAVCRSYKNVNFGNKLYASFGKLLNLSPYLSSLISKIRLIIASVSQGFGNDEITYHVKRQSQSRHARNGSHP